MHVQVLLEYDGDPPLVLCAKLLKIYNTLTQVKLELFGEHSQFSIALKDGATNAFQCLDPIRSAKVRHLDHMRSHDSPLDHMRSCDLDVRS